MAHEVETAFYVKQEAWHKQGIVLESPPDSKTAMIQAGLDWKVEERTVYYSSPDGNRVFDGRKALIRSTDQKPLSIVSTGYQVLQNHEAFEVFDPLIRDGQLSYEAAGSLRGGKRIWVLAKFNQSMEIGKGDQVDNYLTLIFGHDGLTAIHNINTPIRVVCMNTVQAAINQGEKTGKMISFQHLGNLKAKIEIAQAVLGAARKNFIDAGGAFKAMLETKATTEEVKEYISDVCPIPFQAGDIQKNRIESDRAEIGRLIEEGKGADLPGVRGSIWGLYNAAVEFADFYKAPRVKSRMDYLLQGEGQRFKARAYKNAMALVG